MRLGGKLYSKNKFKVGNEFKKGQTLIRLQSSDLKLEIKSVKSEFLSLLIQCLPDIKIDYPVVHLINGNLMLKTLI